MGFDLGFREFRGLRVQSKRSRQLCAPTFAIVIAAMIKTRSFDKVSLFCASGVPHQ